MSTFNKISVSLNKKIDKKDRQKEGIFFTPKDVRDKVFEIITPIIKASKNILEPSFGSGEFISDLEKVYPRSNITGVEKNEIIFENVMKNMEVGVNTCLINTDFLKYRSEDKYDLIIGNPPYFVIKEKNKECMKGRGNIFVLFLYNCIKLHLKTGGILAFVLPTSLYNCCYYEPCREYISKNTTILHVENLDAKYYDTVQSTMILILRKEIPLNTNFILKLNDSVYINPHYKQLKSLISKSTTLKDMGFEVKTGTVVWNQHKDKLSDDGTLLIYSSNIIDNKLVLNNLSGGEKKQYIKDCNKDVEKGPAILIYRGNGNSFKFKYTVIDNDVEFYGENHINIIYSKNLSKEETMLKINTIKASFDNKDTAEFVRLFVGNGALSKTEIENILPIFL